MKKLAIINAVPYGSTGKIVRGIAKCAENNNYKVFIYYSWTKAQKRSKNSEVHIGSFFDKAIHMMLAKITGLNGCFGIIDTILLIRKLKKFKPDVINLHILHCWNINLPIFFRYLQKTKIPVVWTMHDCWAITGQCPYFTMIKCNKWKNGCYNCPQYRDYPAAYVDQSKLMWKLKRKWFTSLDDMTIVTPSKWLADILKQSFLKKYPIKVINNGIDLDIFKPTNSDFRKQYKCENKFIVLGVAFDWGKRKGIDVFVELAEKLDEKFQIVLVGTDNIINKMLPPNIITINKTTNQTELAQIYSAANVFVNPTREDNFPTVNLESLACGVPVITFNTGGSPEAIDSSSGCVVECDDINELINKIKCICKQEYILSNNCIKKAKGFELNKQFKKYISLFDNSKK